MGTIRPLITTLNASKRYGFVKPSSEVDHLVVGAGVVGLAVAHRLSAKWRDKRLMLVERHAAVGQETSSRGSKVIHGGLYYPATSLKTRLCLRGRHLLYEHCKSYDIPHNKLGKLVVGTSSQLDYLKRLNEHCVSLAAEHYLPYAPPTELISGDEAREMEPDLSPNIVAALWSPETGVVDSQALMSGMQKELQDTSDVQLNTTVVRVDAAPTDNGWVVQLQNEGQEVRAVLAKTLVNSTGLSSALMLNSWLATLPTPPSLVPLWFAKGSYFRYQSKCEEFKRIKHLLYPAPDVGGDSDARAGHAGLGVHLTLDMQGGMMFGPDVEWISPPQSAEDLEGADFWNQHLEPSVGRKDELYETVRSYLPAVEKEGLRPDHVGIRPKLVGPGAGFMDFVLRSDWSRDRKGKGLLHGVPTPQEKETGDKDGRIITLMGIESPGLTSSLALAEMIADEVLDEEGR